MRRAAAWAAVALAIAGTTAALAQPLGDPQRGLAYAIDNCAECHAVQLGDHDSPDYAAPPFQEIADTPGMSEVAFVAFFQTPHPSMPNLIVPADDARDLIAYMLTLAD